MERQQRVAQRVERQQRPQRIERQQLRQAERQVRQNRVDRIENRMAARQFRPDRIQNRIDNRAVTNDFGSRNRVVGNFDRRQLRDELRADRLMRRDALRADRQINRDTLRAYRQVAQQDFRTSRFANVLNYDSPNRIYAPVVVSQYVGQPVSALNGFTSLNAFPRSISYLYPDNDDYYYRYGGGYAYRVDRDNDLIDYILPLLAGGFMPGQYLPTSYMNSYVPTSYGLNSFYPASYASYGGYGSGYGYGADYGYGYGEDYGYGDGYDLCNRYYGGVVYQVDCSSGYIEDVVPLYAGGYGVGQMLPSSYAHYNVPSQYRSLYYNTSDANYWYAPGAIYQYDPSSSLITSVAALLTPGFSIGQPLPTGYGMYNVPLGYRDTYYDTPNAWYRYNNGNIYQVDPTTQLVTAIVASVLT
jgi:hypothetical protein